MSEGIDKLRDLIQEAEGMSDNEILRKLKFAAKTLKRTFRNYNIERVDKPYKEGQDYYIRIKASDFFRRRSPGDDWPEFVGKDKIESLVQKELSDLLDEYDFGVHAQEKGFFNIVLSKK